MSSSSVVTDKNDQPIHEGDEVWTKIRGGKREGRAEKIVTTEEEAQKEWVKNPPKVSWGSGALLFNEDAEFGVRGG
ncbi:hypothetical protein MMC18_006677 [Xylographa bjoerkii]|nr:hypothetical protein [Xylographa bjoerkii]